MTGPLTVVSRLWRRFTFSVERQLVRGAQYRLLVVAGMIGLISILGGAAVQWWGTGHEDFPAAVWWAFLRLSDPGYLGDDAGVVNRVVSTALTVLGYVVFLGALVAVMTQWLNARMARLESGLTPIARNDHLLVLGWTNRTPAIVRELLLSKGRVRRFLKRHGVRSLHVVLLVEDVDARRVQDLRDAVGEAWEERTVTVRSGSPIRLDHLERVDFRHATRIIIPGSEFGRGGAESVDTNTIKTLLSLSSGSGDGEELPPAVAEVFNVSRIRLARRAYRGALEVIASDAVVSRLLAQNVRHPGLSSVYNELLTHGTGNEIYIRSFPELEGVSMEAAAASFPEAILLGVIRSEAGETRPDLNPEPGFTIRPSDGLALLARDYEAAAPASANGTEVTTRGATTLSPPGTGTDKRILVLGWNHKIPQLVREFSTYPDESFRIDILSSVPARRRERTLSRVTWDQERVGVSHVEADYSVEAELRAAAPETYDTVMLLGSDWLESEEAADARTILGHLSLRGILSEAGASTHSIVELLDPNNLPLLGHAEGEVMISPLILSHMLALVALRRELRAVFDELFTAGGAEISFRTGAEYGHTGGSVTFAAIQRSADARGETALGVQMGPGRAGLHLNPPRDSTWNLDGGARVVTLVTYARV